MIKKVTGIGGIFFKSKDPEKIKSWYGKHLGIKTDQYGAIFNWRAADNPERKEYTVWSPFEESTNYFDPSSRDFMINYIVDDIERLVQELKQSGVTIIDKIETYDYGKFVHILDPEGNSIELWEPIHSETQP